MVELSTVARPYAEAAFEVAVKGNLGKWSEWMAQWSAVAGHPDIKLLVNNPRLTHEQILDSFIAVSKTDKDAAAVNFLQALVENSRLLALPEIERQFAQLKNAHEGVADARIESAFPLDDAALEALVKPLQAKFGSNLKASVVVDQSLIGGVRVIVGDQILDSSVRGRLDAMKAALVA